MISRLYIDNYRCFVNFEWRPGMESLLLGENGNGKSSVFDVVELLRRHIGGMDISDAIHAQDLTAWDQRSEQTFELEIRGDGGTYDYRLQIVQDRKSEECRIQSERVRFNDQVLFVFDGKEVQLFQDGGVGGPRFPFNASRSAISQMPGGPESTKLISFRERLDRIMVFSPDPPWIEPLSMREESWVDRKMTTMISWLRYRSQESVDLLPRIRDSLREVLPGFDDFRFENVGGKARAFKLDFVTDEQGKKRRFTLSFEQLSYGQRMLVALYSILHGTIAADTTICIDEPDNFVSLKEIQPWLIGLQNQSDDTGCQWLMISHNPEVMNYLASGIGSWFYRVGNGPVRVRPFECDQEGLFKPSEIVAKGLVSE